MSEEILKFQNVSAAISALRQLQTKYADDESTKQSLFDEVSKSPVFLQVSLKKVPPKQQQTFQVALPHTLNTTSTEVCLIAGDLDKRDHKAESDKVSSHYKEILKKSGITSVNEVIPLRQLRTEYKTFESRRQLAGAFDTFLADKRIFQCLPNLLGKAFYKNCKFPTQINMSNSTLKTQIEKALAKTRFAITGRGNCCSVKIGTMDMKDKKIAENVEACVNAIGKQIPGNWCNVSSVYLKTAKSKAIPVFVSFDNPNEVELKETRKMETADEGELSTMPNANVKVFRDGRIVVKRRIEDDDIDGSIGRNLRKKAKATLKSYGNEDESNILLDEKSENYAKTESLNNDVNLTANQRKESGRAKKKKGGKVKNIETTLELSKNEKDLVTSSKGENLSNDVNLTINQLKEPGSVKKKKGKKQSSSEATLELSEYQEESVISSKEENVRNEDNFTINQSKEPGNVKKKKGKKQSSSEATLELSEYQEESVMSSKEENISNEANFTINQSKEPGSVKKKKGKKLSSSETTLDLSEYQEESVMSSHERKIKKKKSKITDEKELKANRKSMSNAKEESMDIQSVIKEEGVSMKGRKKVKVQDDTKVSLESSSSVLLDGKLLKKGKKHKSPRKKI